MGYLDELRAFVSENSPDGLPTKPTEPGFVSFVSAPRRHISETQARATLREWHRHLSQLDPDQPPDGCKAWWRQAVGDSCWLYEGFAGRAVRDGWSALDLFGVWPAKPGWGGLADQLRGARNLKMEGPKAVWSRFGVASQTCAGMGDTLAASGVVLIWEAGR